ncbi:MAG: class I SAM-dependent methyltransferase [Bacteroidetes bacterium]|nr:class I SAM-dependent methyltransferase [Bacteroidota bacterium]
MTEPTPHFHRPEDNETASTWNRVAADYETRIGSLTIYQPGYDRFLGQIQVPGARILDVGCGPGTIAGYLLKMRPDLSVLGTDYAPAMVSLASQRVPGARFQVMDIRHIGTLQERFHGVMGGFCLPYLSPEDGKRLIRDSFDLLLPDGLFYLSLVEGNPERSGFQSNKRGDRVYFYYYQAEVISDWMLEAGFEKPDLQSLHWERPGSGTETHQILLTRKPASQMP